MQQNSKILRVKANVRVLCIGVYLMGFVPLAFRIPERFKIFVLVGYAIVGAFWLADMFLTRIILQDDGIFIFADFRSRTIPRAEIDSVTWEKVRGAYLKLRDGKEIGLPNAGQDPQGVTNTIRAWLKKTETTT